MGLRAKFNLVALAVLVAGFVVAAVVLHDVLTADARAQVLQNARVMLTAVDGVRSYTAHDLKPLLPLAHDGKFVAETVASFAAQRNFAAVHRAFAGYSYREPTLNPTAPADRAQPWEADIIALFRHDRGKRELVLERDTPVGRTLNLARPITIVDPDCLGCHGTPAAAPAILTQTFGTVNGFGWKLHEIVGAQILSVPVAGTFRLARDAYITALVILAATFAIVLAALNLVLHYWVIRPLRRA